MGHLSIGDKGSFLVSHNCSHRALSFWGAVWSLFPSAPHTKGPGAPSPVPKSPFSHPEELSCPSSHLLLATFGFGVFCWFFFQAELNQHHSIALGVHPHSQHLNICSLICRTVHRNLWFSPFLTFFPSIHLEPLQIHVLSLGFVGSRPTARELEDFGGAHLLDGLTVVCALRAWRGAGTLGLTGFLV